MARFCTHCRAELLDRSKFCPKCGETVPVVADTVASSRPVVLSAGGDNTEVVRMGGADKTEAVRVGDSARPRTAATAPIAAVSDADGSSASASSSGARSFAPPTHGLVGRYEQAGFGLRFGALLFDLLFLMIGWMGITFALSFLSNKSIVSSNSMLAAVYVAAAGLMIVNFVVLPAESGQTLGKRIIGIRVIRENGDPLGFAGAVYRNVVGYFLSALGAFLGFVWILWDPKQQGWHDKLARTIVVLIP